MLVGLVGASLMAMNGWGAAEPAWWLNLQADPQAVVELAGGIQRKALGRPAVGGERERLREKPRFRGFSSSGGRI